MEQLRKRMAGKESIEQGNALNHLSNKTGYYTKLSRVDRQMKNKSHTGHLHRPVLLGVRG